MHGPHRGRWPRCRRHTTLCARTPGRHPAGRHVPQALFPPCGREGGPDVRVQVCHSLAGVDTISTLPKCRFCLQTHSENYPRENKTKQSKTIQNKNLAMLLGLKCDPGWGGAVSGRALGRQSRHGKEETTDEEARTPRRPRTRGRKGSPRLGATGQKPRGPPRMPRDSPPCPATAARVPGCRGRPHPRNPEWICTPPHPCHSLNLSPGEPGAFWVLGDAGPSPALKCVCHSAPESSLLHLSWRWHLNSCRGGHSVAAGTRPLRAASSACHSGPKRGLRTCPVLRILAPAEEKNTLLF